MRAGEKFTLDGVPVGTYKVEILHGKKWIFRKYERGAFMVDERASVVNDIWRYTSRTSTGGLRDCIYGGDLSSDDITLDEYFNK